MTPAPLDPPHGGAVDLSLVVPILDGEDLVAPLLESALRWLGESRWRFEVLLVDDGSSDMTVRRAVELGAREDAASPVRILRNVQNRGKGYAVRRGMLEAQGRFRVFTDADLAYPMENLATVVGALANGADVALACRAHEGSRIVVPESLRGRFEQRRRAGRVFNWFVRLLLVSGVRDTQAGLKGFRGRAAEELFRRATLDGFAFDVEIVFLARRLGLSVEEVPVELRVREGHSSVHFGRDSIRMLMDLLRVRGRAWRGLYDH